MYNERWKFNSTVTLFLLFILAWIWRGGTLFVFNFGGTQKFPGNHKWETIKLTLTKKWPLGEKR